MAELGISQSQVMIRTGVNQSTISKLIRGERHGVNAQTVHALAKSLKMDVRELVAAAAGEEYVPDADTVTQHHPGTREGAWLLAGLLVAQREEKRV